MEGSDDNESIDALMSEHEFLSALSADLEAAPRKQVDRPLHRAAREGDLAQVSRLLRFGAEIEARGRLGQTPLMAAAASQSAHAPRVLSQLMRQGAAVHAVDDAGSTALFHVVSAAQPLLMARTLLLAGADVSASNHLGQNALVPAAIVGNEALLGFLLQAGASPLVDSSTCGRTCGRSALAHAVLGGHFGAARLLMAGGASVHELTPQGESLLRLAARSGEASAVRFLLSHGASSGVSAASAARLTSSSRRAEQGRHAEHCGGATPLLAAVRGGHVEVVEVLLENPAAAELEIVGPSCLTALQESALRGDAGSAGLLVAAGASLDAAGGQEHAATPLLLASMQGHEELVQLLLAAGAIADRANRRGVTPLSAASYSGHEQIVARLLAAGAEPNQPDLSGNLPILFASVRAHWPVVARLLAAGAHAHVEGYVAGFGRVTPLVLAAGRGEVRTTSLLLQHGARSGHASDLRGLGRMTALDLALARGFAEVAAILTRTHDAPRAGAASASASQ